MTTSEQQQRKPARRGGDPVAVMSNITMFFDSYSVRALTGVNFDVRRGEVFGVLGPKDSGKTTILKILAGRLRPTEGTARVLGRAPWRRSARSRVGYLPAPGDSAKAGLAGWLESRLGWLRRSRHTRAPAGISAADRVASLAQVIVGNPELAILDEPFAGLDDARREQALELIRTLVTRGKTVILGSDSLVEAKGLCDRMAMLYEGKVQATGTLDELLAVDDAVRFTFPVLPPAVRKHLLHIARNDLAAGPGPGERAKPPVETGAKAPVADASRPGTPDEALAHLTEAPAPAPVHGPDALHGDSIDHRKLAQLTHRPESQSGSPSEADSGTEREG